MIDTLSQLYCPPTIRPDAKICLVGEAPGDKEAYHKQGFIGPAGKLLRELCSQAGINFNECHITNVIKYLPRDIKEYIDISKKDHFISQEYCEHEEELQRELSQINANVFVALGNIPLYALTRQQNISVRRGSIYESTLLPGRKVIACLHPSSCLYDGKYTNRHFITFDLMKAKQEAEFPELRFRDRIIHINPSYKEAIDWLDYILYGSDCDFETSFDTEFVQGILNCFGLSISPTETMCIPLSRYSEHIYTPNEEHEILIKLAIILDSPKIKKIMQNSIFDMGSMYSHYKMTTQNTEDTMIGQAILAPDLPKKLDILTSIYTDMPYFKDQSSKMWKGIQGDWNQFWTYNGKDTLAAHESWHCIEHDLKLQGNWETYKIQNSLVLPLIYMSERGYLMDAEGIKAASKTAAIQLAGPAGEFLYSLDRSITYNDVLWAEKQGHEIGGLWKSLWDECKDRLNPNSPAQLKQYFYITKNIPAYTNRVKTSDGYISKITVDALALKRLARKGYKEASFIQDIRFISKRKSTYYDVKLSEDSRFRTSYNPVGGGGDRLSSSKRELDDEGTNAQNQPKEMKKFFIADPGMILINIDIKQADNRVFAQICPEPTMIEAFASGIDVHALTAVGIFNEPIEKIISDHKAGITCDIGDGTKSKRFWAKKANHSFNYGEGADKFSLSMEIALSEAKRIRDGYLRMYPGIQTGWRWIQQELTRTRTLTNCYRRKRTFLTELDNNTFNAAYSFIPRSTVVDTINRRALNYVYYDKTFQAIEILGQVHDSITFQAPINLDIKEFYRLIKLIIDSIEQPIYWKDKSFILPAEVSIGYNLKDQIEIFMGTTDVLDKIETILNERR